MQSIEQLANELNTDVKKLCNIVLDSVNTGRKNGIAYAKSIIKDKIVDCVKNNKSGWAKELTELLDQIKE